MISPNLVELCNIAIIAGEKIMAIYNKPFDVEIKADNSPVTKADIVASDYIVASLKKAYPSIPCITEEASAEDYQARQHWQQLWLIDPIDGTKEFIKKNGEFTVNIALINKNKPAIGVIYAPALDELYFAKSNSGAYKINDSSKINKNIKSNQNLINISSKLPNITDNNDSLIIAGSRSHPSEKNKQYVEKVAKELNKPIKIIHSGSSLKFCRIAEGIAHLYPRFGRTMEWDTAAGHCILNESSGEVLNIETLEPLKYNKPNLSNPSFIAKK
jgi:3'(2'), 5'-bisphosphate nucleotidase